MFNWQVGWGRSPTVNRSRCVVLIPVGHTEPQLALQSSCIMLSNNSKTLLSPSLALSSATLTFTSHVKSIIFNVAFKDAKSWIDESHIRMTEMFLFYLTKRGLIVNDGCWGPWEFPPAMSSSVHNINIEWYKYSMWYKGHARLFQGRGKWEQPE